MSTTTTTQTNSPPARVIPPHIEELLGNPPVLRGEDGEAYLDLLAGIAAWIDPQDIIEWFFVRDHADATWDMGRLKRIKTHLINMGQKRAVKQLYVSLAETPDAAKNVDALAKCWFLRAGEGKEELRRALAVYGFDEQSVIALSFADSIDLIDKLDRQLARLDAQRRATLRDLDLHRESARLRKPSSPKMLEGTAEATLVPAAG